MNGDQQEPLSVIDQASTTPAPQPEPQAAPAPATSPEAQTPPSAADATPPPRDQLVNGLIATLEKENNESIQKQPASFGMRVATPEGVKQYEQYIQNGGDPEKIPIYDRLAVAIAKDPEFLTRKENVQALYNLVAKPLWAQSWGEKFNQATSNIGPNILSTAQNVGKGIANSATLTADEAQLAFRKAVGWTHDPGYQSLENRLATKLATTAQGAGQGVSDAWNFVTGFYNGAIQLTRPAAEMFTNDAKSREEIDLQYVSAMQDTIAAQQKLAKLGNQVQDAAANVYKATGAFADVGQKIETAQPDEAAAQGVAMLVNPLNYVPELKAAEGAVGAFRPIYFEKATQAMEDVAAANGRKLAYDTSQILPKNPGLNAADPAYIPVRNLQASLAPDTRIATQAANDAAANLAQRLTSLDKIAGDPGTATWFGSQMLQKTGAGLEAVGGLAEKVSKWPEGIARWMSGGNPAATEMITDALKKVMFGGFLEHMGPVGGAIESVLEHAPELADNFGSLLKTAGKEAMYADATLPYGQRVAQKLDGLPKFLAQSLDAPLVQTAATLGKGAVAGAATGAAIGTVQGAGSAFGGGVAGGVSGFAQGGILGMAGGGFGQWQRFRDPNQYLLNARGDWRRYRDMLSPADQANFAKLSPSNQLLLAQSSTHYPGLKVAYVNQPTGAAGFHYFDQGGRSNIQINLANPDSVIRGIMAHELIHGASHSGMLPNLYDSIFGDPKTGKIGTFTAVDAQGKPTGINPKTGRYYANQTFDNLKAEYTNKLAQNGVPTSQINDFAIAREIYAEHGVDYMLNGQPILDSTKAYRPILTSTNALKTAMAKMGYTFDDNGLPTSVPGGSPTVQGTGLFTDLQRVPKMGEMLQAYFKQRGRDGTSEAQEPPTHRFTKKDMQNPNTAEAFLNTAAEIVRNPDGTAKRDPLTGQPIYRTQKEVADYNAQFAQAVRSGLDTIPEAQRAALGMRQTEEGNTFLRYLPDSVLDSLAATNQYNPHQIDALKRISHVLVDGGNPGMEMRFFYHKALTEGKRYRAFEGSEKIAVPYGIEITKDNNVNIKAVDFEQLTKNYQRMQSREPFRNLWKAPDDFAQDAHTYFSNHKDDQPGATGIGEAKRNAINALANFQTGLQRESNPLISALPSRGVRPIIKSYRIDRTNQLGPTGAMRPFISEEQYHQMNRNYLPGAEAFSGSQGISYRPREVADADMRAPAELRINSPERQAEVEQTQAKAQKWLKGKDAPDISTSAYLEGNRQFPTGKMTNEALGNFIRDNHEQLDINKAEVRDRMADALTYDIMHALSRDGNAKGWYDDTVDRSLNHIAKYLDPSILENPENQLMFKLAMAITSQGQKVHPNFESGYKAYQFWRDNGTLPTESAVFGGAVHAEAMAKNFAKVNKLKQELGTDGLRDFLEQPMTVRDLKTKYGIDVSGESKSAILPGATALGAKIGSFFGNLNKKFDTITMDLWLARTMHRMAGDMFGFSEGAFRNQISELRDRLNNDEVQMPDAQKNRILRQIDTLEKAKEGTLTRERVLRGGKAIIDWADTTHALFKRKDPVTGKTYNDRTDINYLAKNIDEGLSKISDDPGGVADRQNIRDVFARTQQNLRDAGIHLTNADAQALIWYREQELFKKAGALPKGSENFDYLDAAHSLVQKYGSRTAQAVR